MHAQDLQPGDEVRARSTGQLMLVREISGDQVLCAMFDGRYLRQVALSRAEVLPCAARGEGKPMGRQARFGSLSDRTGPTRRAKLVE
jgi:uncharacterized protein YodC (DUF2158 family)